MASVGVVVVEDRFECVGRLADEPVVGNVDPLLDIG